MDCLSTVPLGVVVVVVVVVCDDEVVDGGAGGGGVSLYSVVVVVSVLVVPQAEQNTIASVAVPITIQDPTLFFICDFPYWAARLVKSTTACINADCQRTPRVRESCARGGLLLPD